MPKMEGGLAKKIGRLEKEEGVNDYLEEKAENKVYEDIIDYLTYTDKEQWDFDYIRNWLEDSPIELRRNPDVVRMGMNYYLEELSDGHRDYAQRIWESFLFPSEYLKSEVVKKAALDCYVYQLAAGNQEEIEIIEEYFELSEEDISRSKASGYARSLLCGGDCDDYDNEDYPYIKINYDEAESLKEKGFFDDTVIDLLKKGDFNTIWRFNDEIGLPDLRNKTGEIIFAFEEAFTHRYFEDYELVTELAKLMGLSEEELYFSAERAISSLIDYYNFSGVLSIKDGLFSGRKLDSEITEKIEKKIISSSFSDYNLHEILAAIENFNIGGKEIIEKLRGELTKCIDNQRLGNAISIKRIAGVSEEFLKSEEYDSSVRRLILQYMTQGYQLEYFKDFLEEFDVPKRILSEVFQENFSAIIDSYGLIRAVDLVDLPKEFVKSPEVQEKIIDKLSHCDPWSSNRIEVPDIINLAKKFSLPASFFELPKIKEIINRYADQCLECHDIEGIAILKDAYDFPQSELQKIVLGDLDYGKINNVIKAKELLDLPDYFFEQEEFRRKLKQQMHHSLYFDRNFEEILKTFRLFNLSEKESHDIVTASVKSLIERCKLTEADELKKTFNFSDGEINDIAKKEIKESLSRGHIGDAGKIKNHFKIPESEISDAIKDALKYCLGYDRQALIDLFKNFNISEEIIGSPEISVLARPALKGAIMAINSSLAEKSIAVMIEKFSFTEDTVISVAQDCFIEYLSSTSYDKLIKIKKRFNLSQSFLDSSPVRELLKESLSQILFYKAFSTFDLMKENFDFSKEFMAEAFRSALEKSFKDPIKPDVVDELIGLLERELPNEMVDDLAVLAMTGLLKGGLVSQASSVKHRFNLEKTVNSEDVGAAAYSALKRLMLVAKVDEANILKTEFNLSDFLVLSMAKGSLRSNLLYPDIDKVLKIKNNFDFPEEFIDSIEIKTAVFDMAVSYLFRRPVGNDDFHVLFDIKQAFNLSNEVIANVAKEAIIQSLSRNSYALAENIRSNLKVSKKIINSPKVVQVATSCAKKMLDDGNIDTCLETVSTFNVELAGIIDNVDKFIKRCLDNGSFEAIALARKAFNLPPDKALDTCLEVFGPFTTGSLYADIGKFLEANSPEDIPEDLKEIGVTKTRENGLRQLRDNIANFRTSIRDPHYQGEKLEIDFYSSLFKRFVRYETSRWGKHDGASFDDAVDSHRAAFLKGKINPLPEEYISSETINIDKVDRAKQMAFNYSEPFRIKYGILRHSILEAHKLTENKKPLSNLVSEFSETKEKVLNELRAKLETMRDNPKIKPLAIDQLVGRIKALEDTDLRSIKDFENNFTLLATFKEFEAPLRKLLFFLTFHSYKEERHQVNDNLEEEEPTLDNLAWTLDFIDHITNQETRNKYFKDDKARAAFIKMTNVKALEEEYTLVQDQDIRGRMKMKFVPTRDMLFDFSGHIADACWASKPENRAENNPNKSALIMIQNPDTPDERLAGSCILIETMSDKGEPLLVIRGLNPIENVINQLSVEDYYKKLTDHLKVIAAGLGRKLAIAIDTSTNTFGTNRKAIFDYTRNHCMNNKVRLASDKDTRFNNLSIVDGCYLVK